MSSFGWRHCIRKLLHVFLPKPGSKVSKRWVATLSFVKKSIILLVRKKAPPEWIVDMNWRHHTSNCTRPNEKSLQEAFLYYLPLKFLSFTFSSTWAQSPLLHFESWKRLKLTVEDDLNNLPNLRKDEVYLEEGFTIAECTGQFELALEVIH